MAKTGTKVMFLAALTGSVAGAGAQQAFLVSREDANFSDRRAITAKEQPYNIKAGPVSLLLSAALKLEYNDNVNIADGSTASSDFIIGPSVRVNGRWQLSERNALTANIGVGYDHYWRQSSVSTFTIAPDTDIALDFGVGAFDIDVHSRSSLSYDPVSFGNIAFGFSTSVEKFGRFVNVSGVGVTWKNADWIAKVGYDHTEALMTSSAFNNLDRSGDAGYFQFGYQLKGAGSVGVETGLSYDRAHRGLLNNSTSWHVGPYYEQQLTDYTRARIYGGFTKTEFENTGTIADSTDSSSWYAGIRLTHKLTSAITCELVGERAVELGFSSNFVEIYRGQNTWRLDLNDRVSVSLPLMIEKGRESNHLTIGEEFMRYSAGLSVAVNFGAHLSTELGYRYFLKDSDLIRRDYEQNRITLMTTYQF